MKTETRFSFKWYLQVDNS